MAEDPHQFHFDPATYAEMARAEVPAYDELQERVADAASERAARRLLDLGTGTGETLQRVAARFPDATFVGVDESAGMLALAREAVPDAELHTARLQDPLPAGPFDIAVSALAVHHLDAGEKAELFRAVAARLSPGGRFVLGDVVVPDDPESAVVPLDHGYDKPDRLDVQLEWLRDAGFDPVVRWQHDDLAVIAADLRS